jgi:hypothetical protein
VSSTELTFGMYSLLFAPAVINNCPR